MKWAALIVWIITALGGFALLAIWLQRGGIQQTDQPGRRIRPPLIFTHLALAATGLVLWIVYLAIDKRAVAWIAFGLLLVVASLGFGMLALWLQRRQASPAVAGTGAGVSSIAEGATPAEQHFPVPIVAVHGLVAATTLVLVLLAALKVGGS
jgi:flagellar basal body-associated protein FliL